MFLCVPVSVFFDGVSLLRRNQNLEIVSGYIEMADVTITRELAYWSTPEIKNQILELTKGHNVEPLKSRSYSRLVDTDI
ncbi:hypothetical protein H6G96_25540 [Nostoc sp. FACHB-892]|uniref:hypothetical protein n=1 Tax=Nostoc sp. FACHB-892 TaxID=2692843 RepID=UPI0016842BA1|nr:hypothetical protein [Nostoc sp. FACHB-892]MBD2729585.1 hypothetical protein [Nostoc sp. FACHB-892]